MPMRRLFFAAMLACSSVTASFGQKAGYKSVANVTAFQQSFNAATAKVQTLQSDFTQTKNLALLAEKVISKGRFSLRKQDKVRIEYLTPFRYLLVMNAGQIFIKDEQKTSRVSAGSSKTLQSVNRIMLDCMRGTVFTNPDFKTTALESANGFLLSLSPSSSAMSKMFRSIDVYLDKTNYDVTKLTMTEKNGDYTEMVFQKTVRNPALNDELFKVR